MRPIGHRVVRMRSPRSSAALKHGKATEAPPIAFEVARTANPKIVQAAYHPESRKTFSFLWPICLQMGRHEVEIVASCRVCRELEEQSRGVNCRGKLAVEITAPPRLVFQFHMTRLHRSSALIEEDFVLFLPASVIEGPQTPRLSNTPRVAKSPRHELWYLGQSIEPAHCQDL